MNPIIALLSLAVPFVLYFVFKKLFIKYFIWVYNKTDVNPITVPRQLLGFAFFLPILIGCFNEDLFFNPIVTIGIPAFATLCLLLTNLTMKHPGMILGSTLIQILFGILFVARLFVWICLVVWSFVSAAMWGKGDPVHYNPFYLTKLEKDGTVKEKNYNPDAQPIENYGNGVMEDLDRYTDPIDRSRNIAMQSQLEHELAEIRQRKHEDNIYGLDTPELDKREKQIKRDLDYLEKKKK